MCPAVTATWRIAIDTGSTFTDLVAVAPDDTWRRAKVLSSGVLRARIVAAPDPETLILDAGMPLPDGLLNGFELRLLSTTGGFARVRSAATGGRVRLGHPLPDAAAGGLCALASGWPAAVLAAHVALPPNVAAAVHDAVTLRNDRYEAQLGDCRVLVATHRGGAGAAADGGEPAALAATRTAGLAHTLSFDMGGTSTAFARLDGAAAAPAPEVHTVGVGGGTIVTARAGRLTVGPDSVGAEPGPACYGMGGPLTLSDCNLLLGRVNPARFAIPLNPTAARAAALALAEDLGAAATDLDALLAEAVAVADERVAATIRTVIAATACARAVQALVAFGGAGGQHAMGVAARLGIDTVLIPPDPELLSAAGLLAAALPKADGG